MRTLEERKTGMSYGRKDTYEPTQKKAPARKLPPQQQKPAMGAKPKPQSRVQPKAQPRAPSYQAPQYDNEVDQQVIGRKKAKGYDMNFGPEAYGDGYSDPMAGGNEQLAPCSKCGRTFNPEALRKHAKICVKVFQKQRKVFNAADKRMVEPEQKQLLRNSKLPSRLRYNSRLRSKVRRLSRL